METFKDGLELYRKGYYKEAAEVLSFAIREDPDNIKIWNALGVALSRAGDNNRALVAFDAALELDPGNHICKKNRDIITKKIHETKSVGDISDLVPDIGMRSPSPSISPKSLDIKTVVHDTGFIPDSGTDRNPVTEKRIEPEQSAPHEEILLEAYEKTREVLLQNTVYSNDRLYEKIQKIEGISFSGVNNQKQEYRDRTDISGKNEDIWWAIIIGLSLVLFAGIIINFGFISGHENSPGNSDEITGYIQENEISKVSPGITQDMVLNQDSPVLPVITSASIDETIIPVQEITKSEAIPLKSDDASFYSKTAEMLSKITKELSSLEGALHNQAYNRAGEDADTILDTTYGYTMTVSSYSLSPGAKRISYQALNITDSLEKIADTTKKGIEAHDVGEDDTEKYFLTVTSQKIKNVSAQITALQGVIDSYI